MKKRLLTTIIICLASVALLAGCAGSSDSVPKDKPETVEAQDDGKDGDKTEKKEEEKPSKEDIRITDVSWNHGSYEEFSEDDSDITEVYFKLSNGDTITKQVPLGYYVDGKEELDIDGDGENEIIIHQYFSNTAAEYDIVYVFKLADGDVEDITPVDAAPELMDDVANTEIKPLDKEGYPKYMLDVTTYQKDGADVSVKYHASLAWHNGKWEVLESDNGSDDADTAGTASEQEPFFGLWVEAFKDREDADALVTKLEGEGLPASYVYSCDWENLNKDPYFCVTIGKSGSEPEAQAYIEDAKKAGYPKAYVKYTGERLGHRVYYYQYTEGEDVEVTEDKVILHEVSTESVSDEDDEGPMDLVIDADTVFDGSCDTSAFDGYQKGDTPLEWIHHARELEKKDPDHGPALLGVYEVTLTGKHIDRYYGAYWWD